MSKEIDDRFALIAELVDYLNNPNISTDELTKYLTLKTFAGWSANAVYLMKLTSDAHIEFVSSFGQSNELIEGWRRIPLTANVPGTDAVREDRLIWLADREDWQIFYPDAANYPGDSKMKSLINIPLHTSGAPSGVLGVQCSEVSKGTPENLSFAAIVGGLISLYISKTASKNSHLEDRSDYLTKRQISILEFMAYQMTNMQIARELGYSESTIRHETMRIYELLEANGRRDAVVIARKLGIIK